MSKQSLENLQIKNQNKLIKTYDTLFDKEDLTNVNLKSEKVIQTKAIVPENLIEDDLNNRQLRSGVADFYYFQKWFLLSKAILLTNQNKTNDILYNKLKYNKNDDEMYVVEVKDRLNTAYSDDEEQPSEEEIDLNARAICLADSFMLKQNFKEEFSQKGKFENLINEALKIDPDFITKSTELKTTKVLMFEKLNYFSFIEGRYSEERLNNLSESIRTKSQVDELKNQNTQLANQKSQSENELNAKNNIRSLKQERDNKSIWWKIFRPISNLVSYIKLNNAIKSYKETYILPKLDEYKNTDTYNSRVDGAMESIMAEINSNEPLQSSIEAPKSYTAQELDHIKLNNSSNNNEELDDEELDDEEKEFNDMIKNDFTKESDLNKSGSFKNSNDDPELEVNTSKIDI